MSNGIHLIIPIGLPGSGKTYFGKFVVGNVDRNNKIHSYGYCDKFCFVDFDHFKDNTLDYAVEHAYLNGNVVYCDGLFLTEESIYTLVKLLKVRFESCNCRISDVTLVYFNENRNVCLMNDSLRDKERRAEITIKNAPFMSCLRGEFIDEISSIFYGKTNVNIVYRDIYKADNFDEIKIRKWCVDSNGDIRSEDWTTGGYWGNCWGDSGSVSSEHPTEFVEFDEILEELCPNISFLQYKDLYKKVVKCKDFTDYGYYGSYTNKCYWSCNVDELKEELKNMGIL